MGETSIPSVSASTSRASTLTLCPSASRHFARLKRNVCAPPRGEKYLQLMVTFITMSPLKQVAELAPRHYIIRMPGLHSTESHVQISSSRLNIGRTAIQTVDTDTHRLQKNWQETERA